MKISNDGKVKTIKFNLAVFILAVILIVVAIIVIKYSVEGEKNMPYRLSKITIISTAQASNAVEEVNTSKTIVDTIANATAQNAETQANGDNATQSTSVENTTTEGQTTWNLDIIQTNDIYLSFDKDETNCKDETIKSVTIENIQITQKPTLGSILEYMPNSLDGKLYNYTSEYLVNEKLQYRAGAKSNSKTLEIGSQGGTALISFVNNGVATYKSNELSEIKYDGTLLAHAGVTDEQIKFKVSFDVVIEIGDQSYKGTVELELPCENLVENGTTTLEITDFSNVIFKRI